MPSFSLTFSASCLVVDSPITALGRLMQTCLDSGLDLLISL